MTTWKKLQQTLALVAGLGLVLPAHAWSQERKAPAPRAAAPKAITPDISLTADGSFRGSLIDGAKQPIAKAPVTLSKDGQKVASVQTDEKGSFQFANLNQGSYQLEVKDQKVAVRVWKAAVAPPKSLKQLDMAYVPNKDVVRAQFGYLDPVNTSLILLGIAGVVLGGIAVHEISDVHNEIKKQQSP